MSNVIYEGKTYNQEIKDEFTSEYKAGTQKIISRIFKVSYNMEKSLNKDLYDFNREELRRLFFLFMPKTEYSSKANVTWVSKYIEWARDMGYLNDINPLDGVTTEWKEQFVNKSLKKYWTDKEIDKIISKRVNAQDAVIVRMLFEGVRGTGNTEILNLTVDDVDAFNNTLHLSDADDCRRSLVVSDKLIKLCEQALKEDDYEKMNGNASKDIKAEKSNLVTNKFVVKSSNTRTTHFNEAEKNIIHRRLTNIADEEGEPNFSPLNITYSGMLYMAKELYVKNGKLEAEEYGDIRVQFNIDTEQSFSRLKSEFLNIDFIKSFYELT
ncbi:site-specific integrase [Paenibacillus sp. FSL H7-0331]|uniref:site-specific integrase n=1 Tax=Paenibacillus sp. FSL H7-0331 TaxID=1920421 RepID=UPI00096D4A85|nr:site-specific integrase [Paenibacillus sp. FSL H7-0331]OME97384.1 integrase [Paenibacillus sp. FSL H7-0331]